MKVAIIHLSDFHIKDREHFERAKINGIVSSLNALGQLDEYLVVFSGDLANSGGINEYRQSRFLFGQLIGGIKQKNNDKFAYKVYWGCDLQTEHERYLTEEVFKRPVFVTDYPKEIKAFYMRLNDDGKTVAASDLLVPGIGELVGGSQREERIEVLEKRMAECGLNKEDYKSYLDLRRYGGVTHSGFGLGFERMIMYLTGISNIRDVLPFPRTFGTLEN